ncbi:hypothetical protein Y1Q_0015593 [Alligator mississippiensis]|uniref:Uncharacterized protein n=1 Tax=Alligator mississippiensis TaxID=8496 RepID=A0A151NNB6_ALLMI|nr:hypothetical protein Y1Q_0015593 [Alligator mississippiensis]
MTIGKMSSGNVHWNRSITRCDFTDLIILLSVATCSFTALVGTDSVNMKTHPPNSVRLSSRKALKQIYVHACVKLSSVSKVPLT